MWLSKMEFDDLFAPMAWAVDQLPASWQRGYDYVLDHEANFVAGWTDQLNPWESGWRDGLGINERINVTYVSYNAGRGMGILHNSAMVVTGAAAVGTSLGTLATAAGGGGTLAAAGGGLLTLGAQGVGALRLGVAGAVSLELGSISITSINATTGQTTYSKGSGGGKGQPQYKRTKPGQSGKEAAKDVPSWAKGNRPKVTDDGNDFATRLCDDRYGPGNYPTHPGSEYGKIKKWGDRGFE